MRTIARSAGSYSRRPLNHVLASPSRLRILRALSEHTAPLSGREVARQGGLSHQAALNALGPLETMALVERTPIGATYGYRLNRRHCLIEALGQLFHREASYRAETRKALTRTLGPLTQNLTIFGSVAEDADGPASDLDVCLIPRRSTGREAVELAAAEAAPEFRERFGVRLSPLVLSVDEFQKRLRRDDPLARGILEHGVSITGTPLGRLLHGKAHAPKAS